MDAPRYVKTMDGLAFADGASDPLVELVAVRQVPGEPRRRWFASLDIDLIVWCDADGAPIGFELCYDKRKGERALSCRPQNGDWHMAVDDGEARAGDRHKGTPILVADGRFPVERVRRSLARARGDLPDAIAAFVEAGIRRFEAKRSAREPLQHVGPVEAE
ncbi:MAG: hypothetical protein JNK11_17865 [Alphaproteobacteria bacterium]|nr:hypothetical protein [Alphaproteobacteria bacterium]